jgi:hypothetical protein
MKYVSLSIFAAFLVIPFIASPASAFIGEEVRDEIVGLFGTLLTPSIFTTPGMEEFGVSLYGRTLTDEGKVPDFDERPRDEIDEMTIFVSGRLKGLGLTLGFGEGSEFEFSQPFIASLDYKMSFMERERTVDSAIDLQYSMIVLPDEEAIDVSAVGFGVVSIAGMISADLRFLEPYAGLKLNYVYLNSERELIKVWKLVPQVGLQVKPLPSIRIGTELEFINNEHLDPGWLWDIGINVKL